MPTFIKVNIITAIRYNVTLYSKKDIIMLTIITNIENSHALTFKLAFFMPIGNSHATAVIRQTKIERDEIANAIQLR